MTKKLLFGMMSLAMLSACTSDEIESIEVAEGKGNVQFVVMNNDASTRASINGNTIKFSAADGDKFTLYHGATVNTNTGFENATYKAEMSGTQATLTTPSMILPGQAIMIYPADLAFRVKRTDDPSIVIPEELDKVEDHLPYVSDGINITGTYGNAGDALSSNKNTLGYNKEYPITMRPMASQLNLNIEYNGMDAITALQEGEDPVADITVDAISVKSGDATKFTTEIKLDLTVSTTNANWFDASGERVNGNNWNAQTKFGAVVSSANVLKSTAKLSSSESLNDGCKLLFLPQADIDVDNTDSKPGVVNGAVIVDTYYGQVVVGQTAVDGKYTDDEIATAWYRYISDNTTAEEYEVAASAKSENGKYKTTSLPAKGLAQTINKFSTYTWPAGTSLTAGEACGTYYDRYVKVYLKYLDMSNLHIKNDKQLRDVARVWKKLGVAPVTVILDGDADKVFEMSQNTIKVINEINGTGLDFKVMPCTVTEEKCDTIKIIGGGDVPNIAFITDNSSTKVKVALAENETWKWNGTVKVAATAVEQIINKGTMENTAPAVLKTTENSGTQNNVPLYNEGTWNVSGGILRVQFGVYNYNKVNIAKGAEYRQDGANHIFRNYARTLPQRFLASGDKEDIGVVTNKGVFATIDGGYIFNYSLIEHADEDAKTYITLNQTSSAGFDKSFATGKIGTINLPYSNKEEDNISISGSVDKGFVSVTVTEDDMDASGILDATVVGKRVNYINVVGGVKKIAAVSTQVKYLEINQPETEVVWAVDDETTYDGLILLSNVNIKLNTKISAGVTYLGANATMYVGGTFNKATTKWVGYYGDTSANVATNYVTF